MPAYVVGRVVDALNGTRRALSGSHVLVYGLAYKRDVADTRESPSFEVIAELLRRGAKVACMDPLVPDGEALPSGATRVDAGTSFAAYELVVVMTDHAVLDRRRLLAEGKLVVDARNALGAVDGDKAAVHGL
jgi:UDP-N-acetyl-D-glucosamine dehydrogenase